MIFKPIPLGNAKLADGELKTDRKACRIFGPCGVGKKALYLNSFYIDRRFYVPISSITRVFKRVAMSKGGFTGKGVFASIPYLVVEYDNGKEKQCNFKYEQNVDLLLSCLKEEQPQIKLISEAGEKHLEARRAMEASRPKPVITEEAEKEAKKLETAIAYLDKKPELTVNLSYAAKAKRTNDRSNPAYKWTALAITLLGAAAFLYGIFSFVRRDGYSLYFTLFGLSALFLFAGANVLPTKKNNRRAILSQLNNAVKAMEEYLKTYSQDSAFPVPAIYAHPVTLRRMARAIRDGRAETCDEALQIVKADLKMLNSDVVVEQEEYDEVVAVKPMFLVQEYR